VTFADVFMPLPNGVNPAGNFFVGAINLIVACTIGLQLLIPLGLFLVFIFGLEKPERLQLPGNLLLPVTGAAAVGVPLLIIGIFGVWWGFVWNILYSIAAGVLLPTVIIPKLNKLYASSAMPTTLQIGTLFKLQLAPRTDVDVQEPFSEENLIAAAPFALVGFLLPFLVQVGEPFAAILVLSSIFFFSWAIPIAVYALLNSPQIHNHLRFALIGGLVAYYASASLQISPLLFTVVAVAAGVYLYWWYDKHPWARMKAAHDRCKELHAAAQILSVDDFLKDFQRRYCDKWGFDPSTETVNVAANLFIIEAVREIPPLPDMPPFQPTYSPGQDITHRLVQLEAALRDLPVKTNQLVASITNALDAYTAAVPRPNGSSVFTIAAWEMVPDLPALVETLGTAFPSGFNMRASYERNRDYISEQNLGVKAYESGERIDPEAYANV
jgi:hypothetical protein